MKIILDIPDTARAIFINGAYATSEGINMAVTQVETSELHDGAEIVCDWKGGVADE